MARVTSLRKHLAIATCVLSLGALAACGDSDDSTNEPTTTPTAPATTPTESPTDTPEAPEETGTSLDITIEGNAITPSGERIKVSRGETITFNVTSDRAGELHVHSTPDQTLSFGVGETTIELSIDLPGIVAIEEHEAHITIVSLEVS